MKVVWPGWWFFCRNTGFRDEHHFHLSYASGLDTERGVVHCTSGLDPAHQYEVPYDRLVIGVGADCNHFNIPGVLENAFFLKVRVYGYLSLHQIGVTKEKGNRGGNGLIDGDW